MHVEVTGQKQGPADTLEAALHMPALPVPPQRQYLPALERFYESFGLHFGWRVEHGVFLPSDIRHAVDLLSAAALKPGERMLDAGSGDGRVVLAAARLFGASAEGYELEQGLYFRSLEMQSLLNIKGCAFSNDDFLNADFSRYDLIFYFDGGAYSTRVRDVAVLSGGKPATEKSYPVKFFEKLATMRPGSRVALYCAERLHFHLDRLACFEATVKVAHEASSRPSFVYTRTEAPLPTLGEFFAACESDEV